MPVLKIQPSSKVKLLGKVIVISSIDEELLNAIKYNGENIKYDGEVLTFTEN